MVGRLATDLDIRLVEASKSILLTRRKNMKVGKFLVTMTIVFLVIGHSSAIAQQSTTELSVGEELVRELWNYFKTQNVATLESKIAPGFQSIHEDGARNAEEELKLLEELNLGEYTLSNFKVTEVGPTIIVSYFVSVAETIESKRLSTEPAARLTIFLKADSGWQWIAHANLKPLK
jgi:hypothetical protein